jgi:tetratricopeptide (TPR) repeat protein
MYSALASYWWLRGLRGEAAALAREVLAAVQAPPPGLTEEYAVCVLSAAQGPRPPERHAAYMRTVEPIMRRRTGAPRQPMIELLWASTAGPPPEGLAPAEATRLDGTPWTAALARLGAGLISLYRGDTTAAEPELYDALAGFRALGERWGMTMTLAELARLASWRGQRDRCRALAEEALTAAEELESPDEIASLLCVRAEDAARAGDLAGADADFARAAELARRSGAPETLGGALLGHGEVARLRGDLAGATRAYERALAACPPGSFGATVTRAEVYVALGRVSEAHGDAAGARAWHLRALTDAGARDNALRGTLANAVEALAGVALLTGDGKRAALLLGAGTALRGIRIAGDPDADRVAEAARAQVGPAAYDSAFARGAGMSRAEVLNLVTAETAGAGRSADGA